MPRYFFNLGGDQPDILGVDLADIEAARTEAVSFLGAYLTDHPGYASQGHWRVEVTDEQAVVLLNVVVAAVDTAAGRQASLAWSAPRRQW